jgi:hypothetical protein
LRDVVDALRLRVTMLLALGFLLSFSSGESVSSRSISVNSLMRSGKTNEFGSSGLRKATALLREIGFVRFLVYGEEQFFLEGKQFFFARVLEKESSALSMARRLSGSSIMRKSCLLRG